MSIPRFTILALLLIAFAQIESKAQAAKTPFSAFGIGEYYGNGLTQNQGMAGIGVSNPEYWYLNNVNPALLVFNTITVFEAGIIGEQRKIKGPNASEKTGGGNINYLAMGFPVKRSKWAMGVGLMPYTAVNFKLDYQLPIENSTATVDVEERGSGGINQLYWSNGVAINPDFSVGLKASYFFSGIINEYTTSLSESSQTVDYSTNIYDRKNFKGFGFSGGVSFHKDSLFGKKNYQINVGMTYELNSDIKTKFYERFERLNNGVIVDSVTLINNQTGTTSIPQALAAGISIGKGIQWLVGADFTYTDYSALENFNGSPLDGGPGWTMALGGKITPDAGSLSNYLKRMTYRTGVSISEAPYLINGRTFRDFGINFGLALPVSRISSLDLAIKVGKRGDLQTNTIEENYFKLYFGVTFNDQWFIKRRFD